MNFRSHDTFSSQKLITARYFSLAHVVGGAAMLTLVIQHDCTVKVEHITATTARFRTCGCARIQQWGQSRKKKKRKQTRKIHGYFLAYPRAQTLTSLMIHIFVVVHTTGFQVTIESIDTVF
jgi:hypothetical protein